MTADAQVEITSRVFVNSADEDSWRSLPCPLDLGPLDQLAAPFIPVAVILVYTHSDDRSPVLPIDKLHGALARVLDCYPHLTGRLCLDPKSGLHQLDRMGTGAELLEATCPQLLSSYSNDEAEVELLRLPGGGNDLLAPYGMDMASVCAGPVCTIQHTRFACGGVALGIRILHTINDAGGFFKLVSDLGEIYRKESTTTTELSNPPRTSPYLSSFHTDASDEDRARIKAYKPSLFHLDEDPPAVKVDAPDIPAPEPPSQDAPPVPNTGRLLRFTSSDLSDLKARATDPHAPSGVYVSTFDALTAFLHQRVYQARHRLRQSNSHLAKLSPPDLLSPVDVRRQVPDLSRGYTGNAVLTSYAHFEPSNLTDGPLYPIARAIHDMTRQKGVTDQEEIESTVKWMALNDKSKIKQTFRFGNASLALSQWNKIDMYRFATFDQGVRPALLAPPFTPISLLDGLGYYLPSPKQGLAEDKGDIDVYLSLSDDVWAELDVKVQ